MRKYREYTNEDVIRICKEVKSIAGLLNQLGLKPAGGNYANMRKLIQQLSIDTSHWTGSLWSKNKQLKDWSNYTHAKSLKPHLCKVKNYTCESCGNKEWMNKQIPLEVHHVDGDGTNNSMDNLQLLCCNCHALTPSWRRVKK
jgi:hypothetical protein